MGNCSSSSAGAGAGAGASKVVAGVEAIDAQVSNVAPLTSGRARTVSAKAREKRIKLLSEMRKAQEEFTPENMVQFQFLIGMKEEEREQWSKLFKDLDSDGSG